MPKQRAQHKERRRSFLTDQHGRRWFAFFDIIAGDIVDKPTPYGWSAPVIPEAPYYKTSPDWPNVVEIKYDDWLRDLKRDHIARHNDMRQWAEDKFGLKQALELIRSEDPEILSRFPKILDPRLVMACKQGSRWALGFTSKMTPSGWVYPDCPPELKDLPAQYRSRFTTSDEIETMFAGMDISDATPVASDSDFELLGNKALAAVGHEDWLDLEEEHDPQATGGKSEPIRRQRAKPAVT